MKQIKKFEYAIWKPYLKLKEYVGEKFIKNELERPIIKFLNKDLQKIDLSNFRYHNSISKKERKYDGVLYENSYYSQLIFNKEEILFLVKNYGLDYSVEHGDKKLVPPQEYFTEVGTENIDEEAFINFKFLIDNNNKEYLIISFVRYPKDYPERAKDQGVPFLTYIHGIWENPFLTDEIIQKIKL